MKKQYVIPQTVSVMVKVAQPMLQLSSNPPITGNSAEKNANGVYNDSRRNYFDFDDDEE